MGELGLVQEDTIEEIGASIRRMMSDGDAQSAASRTSKPTPIEMGESLGNVANSFKYEPESETAGELPNNVVELAIAQAIDDAEAEVRAEATAVPKSLMIDEPRPPAAAAMAEEPQMAAPEVSSTTPASPPGSSGSKVHPTQAEERRSLLSPHADAVVSGAFNQLATTMSLSGSARTVEELVEDMLRPLLPSWLDVNLPPLVEKLVREEIQRVSRGRRL